MERICRFLLILFLVLPHSQLEAQNKGDRKGFYGSLNLGPGIMTTDVSSTGIKTSTRFGMHICLGYFINKYVQAGLTANGWLFEPFRWTPAEVSGESISNTMLHLQVYPPGRYRIFIKAAYGFSNYTNLLPEKDYGKGWSMMAAVGFENHLGEKALLWGMQLSYDIGRLKYGTLYTPADQLHKRFNVADLTLFIGFD